MAFFGSFAFMLGSVAGSTPVVAEPVKWSFGVGATQARSIELVLTAELEAGWHIYATTLPSDQGPIPTSIRLLPSEDCIATDWIGPEAVEEYDPNFGMLVRHHSGEVRFVLPVMRRIPEAFTVTCEVEYMLCNETICLPPALRTFTLTVPALEQNH